MINNYFGSITIGKLLFVDNYTIKHWTPTRVENCYQYTSKQTRDTKVVVRVKLIDAQKSDHKSRKPLDSSEKRLGKTERLGKAGLKIRDRILERTGSEKRQASQSLKFRRQGGSSGSIAIVARSFAENDKMDLLSM